mmetsp:Transcript_110033/g.201671  ORF Transcript_110033/g.201671 Transcript_110033/m.201671 type:complete len:102 (+) Transcript_110033:407-712(+)
MNCRKTNLGAVSSGRKQGPQGRLVKQALRQGGYLYSAVRRWRTSTLKHPQPRLHEAAKFTSNVSLARDTQLISTPQGIRSTQNNEKTRHAAHIFLFFKVGY